MTSEVTLTPRDAMDAIRAMYALRQSTAIWGPPGIGKSDLVHQGAAADGVQLIDVRASQLDPVDVRGLPYLLQNGGGNRQSAFATPAFLPAPGTSGYFFVDEFNRAVTAVQNAFLQLLLDRKLGDYTLPDGWTVIAACNRESDGGGVTKMTSAAANRLIHLNLEVSVEDWVKWALGAGIDAVDIAFIQFRRELLHQFDRTARAFPTPRSWTFVFRAMRSNLRDELQLPVVAGAVGHGAAVEYLAFRRLYKSLPNIQNILSNPTAAPIPASDENGTLYALSAGLSRAATANNFPRVLLYAERLPEEYAHMIVSAATARDAGLCACREYIDFESKHSIN